MGTPKPVLLAVRRIMDKRGLSVSDVARISGVNRSTLSRWLNGRQNLNSAQAWAVIRALGREEQVLKGVMRGLGEGK